MLEWSDLGVERIGDGFVCGPPKPPSENSVPWPMQLRASAHTTRTSRPPMGQHALSRSMPAILVTHGSIRGPQLPQSRGLVKKTRSGWLIF